MDTYTEASYACAEDLTNRFSASFSMSSRLFGPVIRKHIYAVYGMVRIADEIVDTYRGEDAGEQLDRFAGEVGTAYLSGYSTNPIIHAFADTARQFGISEELTNPFFASMRQDLAVTSFTKRSYDEYIYGSAEVIGLMCLRVFVQGDNAAYERQKTAAAALGSAYQKVNFLRDMRDDHDRLGRIYFPDVTFEQFDDAHKARIVLDIERDFVAGVAGIEGLPLTARSAVRTSYLYYSELLSRLREASAETVKSQRMRLPDTRKLWLFIKARIFG